MVEGLGGRDVRTYVQSGNAIFRMAPGDGTDLSRRLEAAIAERCGFAPRVVLLSPADLDRTIRESPFSNAEAEAAHLHVFFLAASPSRPNLDALELLRAASKRVALRGRRLYFHAPAGMARSRLASRVERVLGVAATARSWRTIGEIRKLVDL